MFHSARRMRGAQVLAPDGPLGVVADALADVASGEVAFVVVDPGGFLPHDVLIVPTAAIRTFDSEAGRVELSVPRAEAIACDDTLDEVSLARSAQDDSFEARFRRLSRIFDFRVICRDGMVGTASDFLIDPAGWAVRYLVVDTHELHVEHEVLVPVEWIAEVDWERARLTLRMTLHRFRLSQHASHGSHGRRR
jgi:hypothetical protein